MKVISLLSLFFVLTNANASINKMGCENVIRFQDHSGQTFLSFMQNSVKPTLDSYVYEGYILASAQQVEMALENASSKVRWVATTAAKGKTNLLRIAKSIEGMRTNLHDLPQLIASVDKNVNRYKLATFFGLASCAGAIIEIAPNHIAYNIHYGTGEEDMDNRTGRSFGEGLARNADDASDKNYLKDLEEFGAHHKPSMGSFYAAILDSIANSDPSKMREISNFGKLLLTDFLAVFTAEQARNLMDGHIHTHWDAALLEVTLLGAFHSGQDQFKLFYSNPITGESEWTSKVYNQANGCEEFKGEMRAAKMYDYWQFSTNTDPKHCRRSGINITKKEFRKLSEKITKYEMIHHPKLVQDIVSIIGKSRSRNFNVFYQLSKFFINGETAKKIDDSQKLTKAYVSFLEQVNKDANKISELIELGEL